MSPKSRTASPSRAARRPSDLAPAASERARRIASTLDCFRRVIRALRVAARHAEEQSNLRPAQLFVLGQIASTPNQSLSELAVRTLTDRTSVAGMVERLAARGLVKRVRGTEDRRRVEIRLTAAGRAVLARAPHAPTEHLLEGLERLDDAALARLGEGLAELVRAMGVDSGPATMLFEDAVPAAKTSRRRRGA